MSDGERGPQGDIGYTGPRGDRGDSGARGARGSSSALSRHVRGSFATVVIVAFLVTSLLGYQIAKTRTLAQRNQVLIMKVHNLALAQAAFRKVRSKQTTATDYKLCAQIESLKSVQRDDVERRLALSLKFVHDHPRGVADISRAELDAGIANTRKTLASLAPSDCHKLPTQQPTVVPKP